MTTIITITAEAIKTIDNNFYDYSGEDRILRNIITQDYEVFYSGQNQGRLDYQLIDSINSNNVFRIYYRKKSNHPFIFLGETNQSSIIKERTINRGISSLPHERLQIRLVIPANNIKNVIIDSNFHGSGKYKKSILQHSNFEFEGVFTQLGFYKK